ncbi:MAG: glutaminyl-peptide cyclotransferase [Planctomycetota bacterium]
MASPKRIHGLLLLSGALLVLTHVLGCKPSSDPGRFAEVLKVRVVEAYPHDANAFTQGLEVEGETLYESTGIEGKSSLRKVDLKSGKVEHLQPLPDEYFGEGITTLDDRIFMLTWKGETCLVFEKKSFKHLQSFRYQGEGWGLTNDGTHLFMSDGSSAIRVLDPTTFEEVRKLRVKDRRASIGNLNELEYFNEHIYANVWKEDRIAKIDPQSGVVVAWVDCSNVYPRRLRSNPSEQVLNGIAYDADSGRTYITGKNWPQLFEIEIIGESESTGKDQ